jgi:cell cycle sensor histidine kinase DivJ
MNAIFGFSELICDPEVLPEKKEKYYEYVRESGNHLIAMIDNLLHLSDIQKGVVHLHKSEFELDECWTGFQNIINSSLYGQAKRLK